MKAFDTYTHINKLKEAGFNEKQAAVIIKSLVDSRETDISHLATREQVNELKNDTKKQISEVKDQVIALEIKLNKIDSKIDIAVAKLESKISEMHTSTLKWMIGTMVAFSGILLTGIKLL